MRASSSANKVEAARIVHHQQQEDTTGEEEIAAEGLLLLPPQLQELSISGCRELSLHINDNKIGGTGGGLQHQRALRSLDIGFSPKFFASYFLPSPSSCFPFPSSLERLSLSNMKGMETPVPLSNLTSHISKYIWMWGTKIPGVVASPRARAPDQTVLPKNPKLSCWFRCLPLLQTAGTVHR